jgi:iron complex transport system substrate-binding protein
LFIFSCKKEIPKEDTTTKAISTINYAKGFDIIEKNGIKKLIIKSAYQNSKEIYEYVIHKNKTHKKTNLQGNSIHVPVQKNCSYLNNTYTHGRSTQ